MVTLRGVSLQGRPFGSSLVYNTLRATPSMNSRWNPQEVAGQLSDPLSIRVYSSRLLGREPTLALHGGGNTSVKARVTNLLGDTEDLLYIKGSGWDLATIEAAGFAPVKLDVAKRLAGLSTLNDPDMVSLLKAAMTDPQAPTPSVETILHAIIPLRFVDHTHADAVVAISNTKDGEQRLRQLYGERVLLVPYVMPGFLLAKAVYEQTRTVDWSKLEGIILQHHGVFTFGEDAKTSYERMIRLVSEAERSLEQQGARFNSITREPESSEPSAEILHTLARLRRAVSTTAGQSMISLWDHSAEAAQFASRPDAASIATRGPLTPDHVIRTKRVPALLQGDPEQATAHYAKAYQDYFQRHAGNGLTALDPAPRWVLWPQQGSVTFGRTLKDVTIVSDIARQTMRAIQWAEALGGWQPLSERDIFDVEYWTLEQAKLKRPGILPVLQGKIALVTGAASGIGKACVERLRAHGAVVVGLDIDPAITRSSQPPGVFGIVCDVTDAIQVQRAVAAAIQRFGGLDILISNAGMFPDSEAIADMRPETWQRSLAVNLSSHQLLLQACIPYLSLGLEPAVIIVASKNVPAPGPGASAYSVAKAGLTQLARVAALELGAAGIRVNVIHPNQVFDTAIWTPDVLAQRAKQYGMRVEEYKTRNLLRVEITSRDVAELACAMAGPVFAKTTGAQIPIDGGNDRVI